MGKAAVYKVGDQINAWRIVGIRKVPDRGYLATTYEVECSCGRIRRVYRAADAKRTLRCELCFSDGLRRNVAGDIPSSAWKSILRHAHSRSLAVSITPEQTHALLEAQHYRCAVSGFPIG